MMMMGSHNTVRAELVEGPPFLAAREKEGRKAFDKLRPNGEGLVSHG
jgi:hypothetical protein